MRAGVVRQPVGADHRMRIFHDPLHIFLGHGEIDRAGGQQLAGGFGLAQPHLGGDVGQVTPGMFGMRHRPGDQHAACPRHAVRAQHGGAGDIGVDVEADALLLHRRVDQRQGLDRAAMIVGAGAFMVRDHHRDVGLAADAESLRQRVGDVRRLVAHMGGVQPGMVVQRLAEFDHLLGRGRLRRRIEQAGRKADGAGFQGFFQFLPHLLDFTGRRSAGQVSDGTNPQRGMADLRQHVHRRRGVVQRLQIAGKIAVEAFRCVADQVQRRRRAAVDLQRRQADPAIAGDHGGHTLADLVLHRRVRQHRPVVMGVHIDEAGGNRLALRVNLAAAAHAAQRAECHDAVVADGDVADEGRPAGAVDQAGVADDDIGLTIDGRAHGELLL